MGLSCFFFLFFFFAVAVSSLIAEIVNGSTLSFKWTVRKHLALAGGGWKMTAHFSLTKCCRDCQILGAGGFSAQFSCCCCHCCCIPLGLSLQTIHNMACWRVCRELPPVLPSLTGTGSSLWRVSGGPRSCPGLVCNQPAPEEQ